MPYRHNRSSGHACLTRPPVACFVHFNVGRRSSGVERVIGNDEAGGSIPPGGTIIQYEKTE